MSWPASKQVLRLARRLDRCTTLGPGVRAVLWVQGCPFRCPGCVAPETLPFAGGTEVQTADLAAELAALPDIEGVTFSGGEPMAQAEALCEIVDNLQSRRDLSFMCYTGYRLGELRDRGTPAQRELLSRLDLLVDGPYVRAQHTDLRWRGSDNQRIYCLTDRYRHLAPAFGDRGNWLEVHVAAGDSILWVGIPPKGFREKFSGELERRGIHLEVAG